MDETGVRIPVMPRDVRKGDRSHTLRHNLNVLCYEGVYKISRQTRK